MFENSSIAKLYPLEANGSDRFSNQMMFVPANIESIEVKNIVKTILTMNILDWWNVTEGSELFTDFQCPVHHCRLTTKREERKTADMILFHKSYEPSNETRSPNQIYAYYSMESPLYTSNIEFPGKSSFLFENCFA